MAVKRLGKGLGALIPEMSTEEDEQQSPPQLERLKEVAVSKVKPNPFQPRETFEPIALAELKQSIAENGVIQPISVRQTPTGFELIAGERRLRAVTDLGLEHIPAYVLDVDSDQKMIELSLIENIQRENLNAIEEAMGYRTLLDECNLTQDEVAKRVGKDRSTITNFLRLLKLPAKIQESLILDEISQGHARALLALEESSTQIALWRETLKKQLSVRQVEGLVKKKKSGDTDIAVGKKRVEAKELSPLMREIENKLRSALGTQVRIVESRGEGKGRIEIEYYSADDVDRILEIVEGR